MGQRWQRNLCVISVKVKSSLGQRWRRTISSIISRDYERFARGHFQRWRLFFAVSSLESLVRKNDKVKYWYHLQGWRLMVSAKNRSFLGQRWRHRKISIISRDDSDFQGDISRDDSLFFTISSPESLVRTGDSRDDTSDPPQNVCSHFGPMILEIRHEKQAIIPGYVLLIIALSSLEMRYLILSLEIIPFYLFILVVIFVDITPGFWDLRELNPLS